MKYAEEIMQILEAFDLTHSYRDAGELAGCDHKTVAHWVARRDSGTLSPTSEPRSRIIEAYLAKIEEWMDASKGKVRADVVHDKLLAMGFTGSERTTRRAVAEVRAAYRAGRRRVHRPWVVEPGLWFQWDYGDGPSVAGAKSTLFCAWLAWSRFRVVIPIRDKTLPTVIACIDSALRAFGGVPTYGLSDNEKTLTVDHVARIPIRNPDMVTAAHHYGLTLHSCLPADAASKGGSEATVRVAKADLVPTEANLLDDYSSWAELEAACGALCTEVNHRPHRVTRRVPAEMLVEERARLHRLPEHAYTTAFGLARSVGIDQPMIQWDWALYSVPARLAGPRSGSAATAMTSSSPTSGPTGRPRWPAIWSPPRATPGSIPITSLQRPRRPWPARRFPTTRPRPTSWLSGREQCSGSKKPERSGSPGCGPRWPTPCRCPSWPGPRRSTGPLAMQPSTTASAMVIWPPSSITAPVVSPPPTVPQVRTTPSRPGPTPGRASGDDDTNPRTPTARC